MKRLSHKICKVSLPRFLQSIGKLAHKMLHNILLPRDRKEIQPVHPKGNQSWIFTGRTDLEAETPILWPPAAKNWLIWKWCWEKLKAVGEGDNRGWDGWMASPTPWTWVWVNSGSWWWTGRPGVLQSMGSQRVRHDWATELNWTEANLHYSKSETLNLRKWISEVIQSCLILRDPMDCKPATFLCPWDFPGKNTGVGSLSLFQGIISTQGLNPGLPHCGQTLYQLSHQGSPI